MFEALRKLTANYTEEEYERYLWYEGLGTFVDMDMNEYKWYSADKLNYTSMKDIVADVQRITDETHYDFRFLCEMVSESVKDGNTYEEAVEYVAGVSYEKDW